MSEAERDLLARTRTAIQRALQGIGKTRANYGLIHADLHTENILVRGRTVTVIDFDDSGYGWHIYELAVALFEEQASPNFEDIRQALLDGYREHRLLSEADEALLPLFFLIRGMAIIGWLGQRPEHDHSDFFEMLKVAVFAGCEDLGPTL